MSQFDRFISLIGESAFTKLQKAHILVIGLGGVGGHVVETLVRAGVGQLTVMDDDIFEETNLNRQILATHATLGQSKAKVCQIRCQDINPNIQVRAISERFTIDSTLNFSEFSYIVDAVDDVEAKLAMIKRANEQDVPIISCMGTAKKVDPTQLKVDTLANTSVCPLASVMRRRCREAGLDLTKVKCVYSTENPQKQNGVLGSSPYVPSVAGILIAKTVIDDIIKE